MATNTYAGFYSPSGGVSPDDVKRRKSFAEALLAQGTDTSAVQHPLQAAARALQGAMGGYLSYKATEEGKAEQAKAMSNLLSTWGGQPQASATETTATAMSPQAPPQSGTMTVPPAYQPMIDAAAFKFGMDPKMLAKQLWQESRFNPNAVSPKGASGIAQFMPGTAAEFGIDPRNPSQAITAAAQYVAQNKQKFGGNDGLALAAYNWGPGSVERWLAAGADPRRVPTETRNYVHAITGKPIDEWISSSQPSRVAMGTGTTPQAPAAAGGIPANSMRVVQAAMNPWLPPGAQAVAGKILEQQLKPRDQWVEQTDADGNRFQQNLVTGERKAMPTDVLPEKAVDQKVRIATAGKPVTTIDQRAPDEFEKEYGQGMGKEAVALVQGGNKAVGNLQRINLTEALLSQVETGKLTPAQATIGSWAKAVGIDPKTLGIDPNLSIVSEAGQALINQSLVGQIGSGGFPANNFSNPDREFLVKGLPSLANQPGSNKILFEIGRRIEQRNIDKADAWAEARGNKQSYEQFDREWRKKVAGENMFADIQQQIQGMQGGQLGTKPAAPQPGAVQQGYRFRGGDPSKPESWEKVQ